jgi:uncharacterized membrane protein
MSNFYNEAKNSIAENLKQKDINCQINANVLRKNINATSTSLYKTLNEISFIKNIPVVVTDFLKEITGALFIIYFFFGYSAYYLNVNPLHMYSIMGIFYSMQATVYKYRMNKDPNYKIPKCKCASRPTIDTQKVLSSDESIMMFNIPNSIFGTLFYVVALGLNYMQYSQLLTYWLVLGFLSNFYFAYIMVFNIKNLCSICINIYAINTLLLYSNF